MKISVNNRELFEVSEMQKKVLCDYMCSDILENDLNRRLKWVLMHLYQEAFKQFKVRGDKILEQNNVKSVPLDKDEYTALVIAQPNYKDRKARDLEMEQGV